jgi:hypothetical protein
MSATHDRDPWGSETTRAALTQLRRREAMCRRFSLGATGARLEVRPSPGSSSRKAGVPDKRGIPWCRSLEGPTAVPPIRGQVLRDT